MVGSDGYVGFLRLETLPVAVDLRLKRFTGVNRVTTMLRRRILDIPKCSH